MKRFVIIGGAEIGNYDRIAEKINADDFIVYCDSGLKHKDKLGIEGNLIIGDFDSHEKPVTDTEIIELPVAKDDTDTVYAVKEGIKRGFDEFILLGVYGQRLDHTLCNIYALLKLRMLGKIATAYDDYGEFSVISNETAEISDDFSYFSLVNISGRAKDITITGAKFNIEHAEIACNNQYGTSNEVLPGSTAKVTVGDGTMLLIKIY